MRLVSVLQAEKGSAGWLRHCSNVPDATELHAQKWLRWNSLRYKHVRTCICAKESRQRGKEVVTGVSASPLQPELRERKRVSPRPPSK